ncbi:nitroreductase family protein [Sphingobacterium thalpophilum]|uniref:nitroreductase family protein n=1 Tax=Sphingobacterium thalpophilum TaxID=259 RepID=UPI003DA40108
MEKIKKFLRPIYKRIIVYKSLIANFLYDFRLYSKYSIIINKVDLKNKEADLILNYHSLEKGMLFSNMKAGFARYRIENLHKILVDPDIMANANKSQIKVGYQVMCKYYEIHLEKGLDISSFYSEDQYKSYKNVLELNNVYKKDFSGVYNFDKNTFFQDVEKLNFYEFAHSRKSTRDFTGELIAIEAIKKVIKLANTSPSVCNRQASNVYLLQDKSKIDALLEIQGGFVGYSKNVKQLLILTNDRKYYYTVGERNQFYIDGGIYLMNLLFALHFYKIGNCPANWGKTKKDEERLKDVITIPESEKIICIIPIGEIVEHFSTTLSLRREIDENLHLLD